MLPSPGQAAPNIRHWGRRDMRKFRAHFMRWLRKLLGDLPLKQRSELILSEIQDYVTARQKPRPKQDPTLMNLRSLYIRKVLAGHEWALAMLHADAINASRKGRPRDGNESSTDGNNVHKRRRTK